MRERVGALTNEQPVRSQNAVALEIAKLVGHHKKGRPLWQTVNTGTDRKTFFDLMVIREHRKKLDKFDVMEHKYNELLKDKIDITGKKDAEYVEKMLRPLPDSKLLDRAKRKTITDRVDIFKAFFEGFESIDEYKAHMEYTAPHWLKDLFRDAIDFGVVLSVRVTDAFRRLCEFYDVNYPRMAGGRAKVCMIIQSLPYWDASRGTVQRALDFILRHIIKSVTADTDLETWLDKRNVVRLSLPPITEELVMSKWQDEIVEKRHGLEFPCSSRESVDVDQSSAGQTQAPTPTKK